MRIRNGLYALPGADATPLPRPECEAVLAVFDHTRALTTPYVHAQLLRAGKLPSGRTVTSALRELSAHGFLVKLHRGLYALPGYRDPALDLREWSLAEMWESPHGMHSARTLAKMYRCKECRPLPLEMFEIELRSLERTQHIFERNLTL